MLGVGSDNPAVPVRWKSESCRQVEAGQTGRKLACLDRQMHDLTSQQHPRRTCRTRYTTAFVGPALDRYRCRERQYLTDNQSMITPNRPVHPYSLPLASHARRARAQFTCTHVLGEPKSSTNEAATVFQSFELRSSETVWHELEVTRGATSKLDCLCTP